MAGYLKTKAEWVELIDELDGIYEEYISVWNDNAILEAFFHGIKEHVFGKAARSCEERASDLRRFFDSYLKQNEIGCYRLLEITCPIHAFFVIEYNCCDEFGVTEICYRAYDPWLKYKGDFSFDVLDLCRKVDWLITVY